MDVPGREPELEFSYDGDDLVIRTHIGANNSAHVLWTHWITQINDIVLCYHVVQNRDLFVRSRKRVEVEWRIPGRKREDGAYRFSTGFHPTSEQLSELIPRLRELEELGAAKREARRRLGF